MWVGQPRGGSIPTLAVNVTSPLVRCHHTGDLSPQLRPSLAKDCIFSPLPAKPAQGCHEPTIPNVTNFIPKAFHPLPKTGVTADASSHPAGSCWGSTTPRRTTLPMARRSQRSRMFRYGAGPGECGSAAPGGPAVPAAGADPRCTSPLSRPQDHCFYQGHVRGYADSAASISTCGGLR